MNDKARKLEEIIGRTIAKYEPLAEHRLLKISVAAEMYVEIDAQDVLIKTINAARSLHIPVYILGSGARIEVEQDIKGLVIKNLCRRFDKASLKGTIKKKEISVENVQVY